jgi:four helix bundle protein
MPFKFENLQVWQKSIDFADSVYDLSATFPKDEVYNLTSQIRRAALSISLNIAEGSSGQSNAEFQRFLGFSIRSTAEVVTCLFFAHRRKYILQDVFQTYYSNAEEIFKMLNGLKKALK